MDTKLKNIKNNNLIKITLVVSIIGLMVWCYYSVVGIVRLAQSSEIPVSLDLNKGNYFESETFFNATLRSYDDIGFLLVEADPEAKSVKSKKRIDLKVEEYTNNLLEKYNETVFNDGLYDNDILVTSKDPEFLKKYQSSIDAYKVEKETEEKARLEDDKRSREKYLKTMVKNFGLVYYAKLGDKELKSSDQITPGEIEKQKYGLVYKDGEFREIKNLQASSIENYIETPEEGVIYLGYKDSAIDEVAKKYSSVYKYVANHIVTAATCFGAAAILGIWLLVLIGKKGRSDEVHLTFMEAMPIDVHLLIAGFILLGCLTFSLSLSTVSGEPNDPATIFGVILCITGTAITLNFAASLTRLLKKKEFKNHLLVVTVFGWIVRVFKKTYGYYKEIIAGSRFTILFGLFLLISCLALLIPYLLILYVPLFIFGTKTARSMENVIEGVKIIKEKDSSHVIPSVGYGPVQTLAEDINAINMNLLKRVDAAVEKETKSQRMKTELITNVSHDLRNPLTSIITYVDLLKKENLSEEERMDYLNVLDEKSQRLKHLTDDLFEAAKAASKNIEVHLESVDLLELVRQGIGEFEEKFEEKNLKVLMNENVKSVFVLADGRYLWRVLENLFSNVCKYSLVGTRVYVDVLHKDNKGCVTIKNISESPLNIEVDELLERFKRGDASRGTEGSGLGLSIAKDLLELQNGSFHLNISGDLFSAEFDLELADKNSY